MIAVIAKIISMQASLTVSENEIAQYVINNPGEIVTSTITAIAKKTNTSEASINRFCKKIGFKGYNSFKIAVAQENFYNNMSENKDNGDDSVISSISHDYRQMLMNTSAMIDEEVLIQAATSLKTARNIYIFAFSSTACVASELELKLQMAGLNAMAVTDTNKMRMFASRIQKTDIAIVIVPSILIRDLYQTVTTCKNRDAKVLSITSYDSPKIDGIVDYKFIASDKITMRNSHSLSNNLMFLYIVDVLFGTLLDIDKTLRLNKLNNDAIISAGHITDNYMLEF